MSEYKEPKKRVTKNDKKAQREIYSSKHTRNQLKQMQNSKAKRNDGPLPIPEHPLQPDGCIPVQPGTGVQVHRKKR